MGEKAKKVTNVTPSGEKMTEKERREKKRVIIESLKNGSTRTAACQKAKMERITFYRWLNASKKFRKRVEEALLSQVGVVEDALYKSAVEGNVTAQKFFLYNRASGKWKDKIEQKFSGDLNIKIISAVPRPKDEN